jgi:phage N-6-adenine-methyltransferase
MSKQEKLTEKLTDCWRTPKPLLDALRKLYGPITLDPYSQDDNPTEAKKFFTKDRPFTDYECLEKEDLEFVFINPPFSRMRYLAEQISWLADHATDVVLVGLPNFSSKLLHKFEADFMLTKWDGRLEFEPPPGLAASSPKIEAVLYIRSCYLEKTIPAIPGWTTWGQRWSFE